MIAPQRQVRRSNFVERRLRRARRTAAAALFADGGEVQDPAPDVSKLAAWLVVAWMTVCVAVYFARLFGLWPVA